ncbi:dual specificity protein phosphatase family protein [Microseira sp. BLCC-F43]|jgi:predicted protein tyrosine phosphatase|uniref:dual specificity protein phosphatase family protein n=1 Tax=Microseira sp. BLCC-F43 TaxID=3153602 RepID=UPI0035BC8FFA
MIGQVKRFLGIKDQSPSRPTQPTVSWVLPGKLAVGGLPQAGDAEQLLKGNVKVVLSLCAESEGSLPDDITENFQCLRLVLPDRYYTANLTAAQLAQAVDIVRKHVDNGLPIFVHCLAGVERSPTVCIAYLCRYHKLELWEALNWLKQVHPGSMPSASELRAIREYIDPA